MTEVGDCFSSFFTILSVDHLVIFMFVKIAIKFSSSFHILFPFLLTVRVVSVCKHFEFDLLFCFGFF